VVNSASALSRGGGTAHFAIEISNERREYVSIASQVKYSFKEEEKTNGRRKRRSYIIDKITSKVYYQLSDIDTSLSTNLDRSRMNLKNEKIS